MCKPRQLHGYTPGIMHLAKVHILYSVLPQRSILTRNTPCLKKPDIVVLCRPISCKFRVAFSAKLRQRRRTSLGVWLSSDVNRWYNIKVTVRSSHNDAKIQLIRYLSAVTPADMKCENKADPHDLRKWLLRNRKTIYRKNRV